MQPGNIHRNKKYQIIWKYRMPWLGFKFEQTTYGSYWANSLLDKTCSFCISCLSCGSNPLYGEGHSSTWQNKKWKRGQHDNSKKPPFHQRYHKSTGECCYKLHKSPNLIRENQVYYVNTLKFISCKSCSICNVW